MAGGQAVGWGNRESHSVAGGIAAVQQKNLPQLLKLARTTLPEQKRWGTRGVVIKQQGTDKCYPEHTGWSGRKQHAVWRRLALVYGGSRCPSPSHWDASKPNGIALF